MNKPHINDSEMFKHLKIKLGGYEALKITSKYYKGIYTNGK